MVQGTKIKGEVFSPLSSFITLEEKPVDQNGMVTYSENGLNNGVTNRSTISIPNLLDKLCDDNDI
jgi:hypothetical protein